MQWSEAIQEHIQALNPIQKNAALLQRLMSLTDLTSLNASDTEDSMNAFFNKAQNVFGHVAAVCIYPHFLLSATSQFVNTKVKVGTVANFPEATTSLELVLIEINRALQDGAQEIDVVFPYQRYLAGEKQYAHNFIEACKAACGESVLLKVILETGVLADPAIIADASYDALSAGADFIKTSTGKISEGATLEAAATMLLVIKHITPQLKRPAGFKVSGGIKTIEQAAQYLELADQIMDKKWATPMTFRIGTSKLVDEILNNNEGIV